MHKSSRNCLTVGEPEASWSPSRDSSSGGLFGKRKLGGLKLTGRSALKDSLGILGPIELADFRDYLFADSLDDCMPRGMGGTPVTLLCKEVLRRGRNLVVFTLDPAVKTPRVFEGEHLRIYFGLHTNKGAANLNDSHLQFLSEAIEHERPRLLHAHFTYEYALAAVISGLPHVVTAHDATLNCLKHAFGALIGARKFRDIQNAARGIAFRIMRTLMAYRAAPMAQRLVAVSPYVAHHLRRYGFRADRVEVIPNGIPGEYFERPCKTSDGPFTFATALVDWDGLKNGATAVEAFAAVRKHMPSAQMLMFGHGYSLGGPAARWASQRGWEDGIIFMGQVSHQQLIDLLARRVDVLVHTSLEEAHPMPLIEAMSLAGCRKSSISPREMYIK
jgi:L-malate glycosyltransferase